METDAAGDGLRGDSIAIQCRHSMLFTDVRLRLFTVGRIQPARCPFELPAFTRGCLL